MPDYYVLVSIPDSKKALELNLCGHLYSVSHKYAVLEAKEYADKLNGGWPLEVLRGQFHTVTACSIGTTRMMRGFPSFRRRRVSDPAKWKR